MNPNVTHKRKWAKPAYLVRFLFAFTLLFYGATSQAQFNYVNWNFNTTISGANYSSNFANQQAARTTSLTNATISNLTLSSNVTPVNGDFYHRTTGWPVFGTLGNVALDRNRYIQFTIQLGSGQTFPNSDFTLSTTTSGNSLVDLGSLVSLGTNYEIEYSWDGGATFVYLPLVSFTGIGTNTSTKAITKPANITSSQLLVRYSAYGVLSTLLQLDFRIHSIGLTSNTGGGPIVVTANQPSAITATGATFNGSVNTGSTTNSLLASFNYGTTTSYGTPVTASPSTVASATAQPVSATVSNLSVNTQYHYQLQVTDNPLTSTIRSSDIAFYTLANPALAPVITAPPSGSNSLVFAFNASANGNPAITTYAIRETTSGLYLQANGTLGATAVYQTQAAWAAPKTITGLTTNTQYSFSVIAQNGDNVQSAASPTATKYTLANIPGTLTIGSKAATSVTGITIAPNGNPVSTTYSVKVGTNQYVQANGTLGSTEVFLTATDWATKTVTGLTANTQYSFSTEARNGDNVVTGFNAPTTFYTAAATPLAPVITAPASGSNSLIFAFNAASDGNPSNTTYAIQETTSSRYLQADGTLGTTPVYQTQTAWGAPKTITGLTANTSYSFAVIARNAENVNSAPSPSATKFTLANTPGATVISNKTATSISVAITANGNPANTTYSIKDNISGRFVQANGSLGTTEVFLNAATWATTSVTPLTVNTQYDFTARAKNGDGVLTAFFTPSVPFYSLANVPSAPSITNTTNTTAKVTIGTNGNPAANTTYSVKDLTSGLFVQPNGTLGSTPIFLDAATWAGITITGLTPGTAYNFASSAKNGDGIETAFSTGSSVTTASDPIIAAVKPDVTATGATLKGTANSGGSGITLNTSFQFGATTGYGTTVASTPSSVTSNNSTDTKSITGTPSLTLTVNTQYHFRVAATSTQISGTPIYSADYAFYTLANTPIAPVVNNITYNSAKVTINATGNPSNTLYAVQVAPGIYVQANGSLGGTPYYQSATAWANTTIINLASGTTYSISVSAQNGDLVNTPFGASVSITTDNSPVTANYRSIADGNFSDAAIWQYEIRAGQWVAASAPPGSTNSITVSNTVNLNANYAVGTATSFTLTSGSGILTIAPNYTFSVNNGGTANFNGQSVTVQSNINGTGRIGVIAGSLTGAGNLTIERFIPYKLRRKWTFVSSPVRQSIRDSWQQQVFITGPGTGGTPCGTTTNNGGATDKYNSNGFDDTQNDPPSLFTYNQNMVSNSHWISIANTTATNVAPGLGFRINIRGDRTVANACADQINYYGTPPTTPQDVKLIAKGSYPSTADLTVALNNPSVHAYTLLGNPFPSEVSFTAFFNHNSSIINNKTWLYSGKTGAHGPNINTNDIYSAWNSGQVAGFALPIENLLPHSGTGTGTYTDVIVSSGLAFFVEAKAAGSVTFAETDKSSELASGNEVVSRITPPSTWTNYVRVHMKNASDNSEVDNIIVRYHDDKEISNSVYGEMDSYSLNAATASLSSLKAAARMAIQTRRLDFTTDTVALAVGSAAGNYRLTIDEFEKFTKASDIYLIDNYLHTTTNLKKQLGGYAFAITTDSASQGSRRFSILFSAAGVLPLRFVSVQATRTSASAVQVNWKTSNEVNVASYEVEHSVDGTTFTSLGKQATNITGNYAATDNEAQSSVMYYRIKATDKNGAVTYSQTATVAAVDGKLIYVMYPNPVRNTLFIKVSNGEGKAFSIKIASAGGNIVANKQGKVEQGIITLPVNKLASGIYIADITIANSHFTQKIVKD